MGTLWTVRLAELPDGVKLEQVQHGIEQRLLEINQLMSTYISDSAISRFNQAPAGTRFEVPEEFSQVLRSALVMASESGGMFDPTVGPLVNLWGFGPAARSGTPPSAADLEQARARIGYRKLEASVDADLIVQPGGLYLDLSAIAKGYAVDALGAYLDQLGIHNWLVDIGGDLRARGSKPGGVPWRIAIERPLAGRREIDSVLEIHDLAVATSGDYRNFFEADGQRFSHTIDPRTGRPVSHQLASVSVLHQECMEADGLATLLTVMGAEEGMAFAEARNLAVLFIVHEGDGFKELMTSAFRHHLMQGRDQ
ncbi:FAD:protein FMN transferase [Isoalcanivorax beigongshangi]|uniref:FAD:protein FMN transferase n=1 Tax=Isoalcanivorax beigongshangi TaxID=3238810 RepID=A0ABV4AG35_9GAMM